MEYIDEGRITVCVTVVAHVIVEHELLNALLLGSFGFLLHSHGNSEIRIYRQIDGAGLKALASSIEDFKAIGAATDLRTIAFLAEQ